MSYTLLKLAQAICVCQKEKVGNARCLEQQQRSSAHGSSGREQDEQYPDHDRASLLGLRGGIANVASFEETNLTDTFLFL